MIRRRDALRALPAAGLIAAGCAPVTRRFAAGDEEGGIGGTGIFGTGIFGTVTALGSLRVNGLLVQTGPGTVMEEVVPVGPPVLPGDTVAIEAAREDGALRARRVTVFHALLGPAATLADGRLSVLGTPVALAGDVPLRAPDGGALPHDALRPGMWIAVSGLWREGMVVATSLRQAGPGNVGVLRGQLRRRGFAWYVGATRLLFRGLRGDLPEESFVIVRGVPDPNGLVVESIEERPLAVFSRRVAALSVEGFAARNRGAPGFHLSGFGLPFDPSSPAVPPPGERQLLLGTYGQTFRVEAGLALPADPAGRSAVLDGPAAAGAIRRWLAAA